MVLFNNKQLKIMKNNSIIPEKSYSNADKDKEIIYKENKAKSGIYRWNNLINGKSYIGSSVNLTIRLRIYYSFQTLNKRLTASSSIIYKTILKHGYSNFSLDILEYCEPDKLVEREQYYIDLLNPEYNILKKAYSRLGHKHTEKARKAMSIAKTGRKHTQETIKKLIEINKEISMEIKLKLSLRSSGIKVEVFDVLTNIKYEFPSMTEAAIYLGITYQYIRKIFNNTDWSYKNFKLKFKLKDQRIWVYDLNQELINIFDTIKLASKSLNIPVITIRRYIKSKKLYKNKYFFYNNESHKKKNKH